ncbi:MAG: hypothetical protein LDL56_04370 [Armatimonadetes bacterium]|nr:hypothetical protein [Armatimonadota bacterium]
MPELDILHPTREVPLAGGSVTVHELGWRDALRFTEKLGVLLGEFTAPDGRLVITVDKLVQTLTRSGDLAADLIAKSTGLAPGQVDALRPVDALALLEAAIEINLHEDLLGKARRVGQALGRVLGADRQPPAGAGS